MRVIILSERVQKFNGVEYRLYGKYFHRAKPRSSSAERYLHRAVWAYHHGPIPLGYHIHHLDHNGLNNQVRNLDAVEARQHGLGHLQAWYLTPEAKQLHRAMGLRNVHHTHENIKTFTCVVCGTLYQAVDCGTNKYCSPLCCSRRDPFRVRIKEQCICAWCGSIFMARKGRKPSTCSRSCARRRLYATPAGAAQIERMNVARRKLSEER